MSDPVWALSSIEELPLRDDLRGQMPYGAPQIDVEVQLNVNENPYPPSDRVVADIVAAVSDAARNLNRYPDREFVDLRCALAKYLTEDSGVLLSEKNVWAANGSNEVLQQVLQAFGGPDRTALSFAPSYPMYPEYSRNALTKWVDGRRNEDFTLNFDHAAELIDKHEPAIVFLTSPNNPTGTAIGIDEIESILEMTSGMVLVDEAYAEFRRKDVPSAITLLPKHPRLIVSRTMSKAFALAGGRVGYVAAHPAVVDALRIVRLPYHLSKITQAMALAALSNKAELLARVSDLRDERDSLLQWLRSVGLSAIDSDANFILFGQFDDRHAIWKGLVDRGVLIRETGPAGWLRVSIGTPHEMRKFKKELLALLGGQGSFLGGYSYAQPQSVS